MARPLKKALRVYIFCILIIMAIVAVFSFNTMAADTIKIGVVDAFSGPFEYIGRYANCAINFVVDEQNAKGGLLGKKIELLWEDGEMKPDVSVRKAKKLILQDKVQILAGCAGSHVGIALNQVSRQYKKLTIQYAAAANEITGKEFSPYSFRVGHIIYPYSQTYGILSAKLGLKKFYIIVMDYAGGRDYGKSFREAIKKFVPDAEIVGEVYHPIGNKDFAPYITKIVDSKPDAVVTGNWGPDFTLLVNQSRSLGMKAPFIAMFAADPTLLNVVQDAGTGNIFSEVYSVRVNTPENQEMIAKYHAKHKNDKNFDTWWPTGLIGVYICGWKMALAAVEKAGSLDPDKIIETFEGFSYRTPVGIWTMRKCDHQAIFPMFGGKIEGGLNPYFNGSIRPDIKFPFEGPDIITFPGETIAIPATPEYNPRCK